MNVRVACVCAVHLRPMLVSGMLAAIGERPVILVDSEQPDAEQAVALWHEVAHLLGVVDEAAAEAMAVRLAAAVPEILELLPVIRVVAEPMVD